ncbi:MAG: esterase [Verrucomicrobia bacterium]|nr:esterase [Verrucomicrobiota bacterium]
MKAPFCLSLLTAALVSAQAFLLSTSVAPAQEPKTDAKKKTFGPPAPPSPEISADRKVTFRLRAPNAKEVSVTGEIPGGPHKMTKDDNGVWSVTVGPLTPELYGYTFVADGLRFADPGNPNLKPMRSPTTSILDIPGDPPLLHDFQNVPHGTVRVHYYQSKATGTLRRMHIYTPPPYDKDAGVRYPTLYLFHGSGDNDACWTVLGRAHWILDNLLAQGKVKPMVVVMTDGHAASPNLTGVPGAGAINRNVEIFGKDLLEEVMPFVEANYRVKADRLNRAIIGLSMGGGQSLTVGLNNTDKFAWVGGMSSALRNPDQTVAGFLADPKAANEKLKILWTACGRDDQLMAGARSFSALLKDKGIEHELVETDGAHSWPVWRKHLALFAPLIFK